MRQFVLAAVLAAGAATQAVAMTEYGAPFLEQPLTRGGKCVQVRSYIVQGDVSSGVHLKVKIGMTAVLTDGRRVSETGTPLFVFAQSVADLDDGMILPSPAGKAAVPGRGVIRVLAQEEQAPPPKGIDHYEDYRITVCPQ